MTTRALVLGGGGPVGVAWETGLIAGFAQHGVDLSQADYVLGTSAGAIVGARLRLAGPAAALADRHLEQSAPPPSPALSAAVTAAQAVDIAPVLALVAEAQGGTRNPAEVRRDLGALALSSPTLPEAVFREMISRSLGLPDGQPWPARDFACTAVDAEDGGFQLWDAASGVDLKTAVTASCSVPTVFPPVTLSGRRYIDGGMRSFTNADLAGGYDVIVVLAVTDADLAGRLLDDEIESLKSGDATVVAITPDEGALAAMGSNLLDFSRGPAVALAALAQAAAQAAVLGPLWG
jgi:NTE family protein